MSLTFIRSAIKVTIGIGGAIDSARRAHGEQECRARRGNLKRGEEARYSDQPPLCRILGMSRAPWSTRTTSIPRSRFR